MMVSRVLALEETFFIMKENKMIVTLEENLTQEDISILIKYAKMDKTVKKLVHLIKSIDYTVACQTSDEELRVNASDIYYIESIDKKTFVYCKEAVYRTKFRLYQLKEELQLSGFVQISKSCILNLNVLESVRPLLNSRLEALLANGEKINVSRKYINEIKKVLESR